MTADNVGVTNQPLSTEPCDIHSQAQPEATLLALQPHCCHPPKATDPDVPMDPPLPLPDDQTEPLPLLLDSHTGDVLSSLSNSHKEITSPAYKRKTETVPDLSEHINESMSLIDKTTGPLSGLSNSLSQEAVADLDCLCSGASVLPSCGSLCFEDKVNTKPVPSVFDCHTKGGSIGVHHYIGSTRPLLPVFDKPHDVSDSLISTPGESHSVPSEAFSDFYTEHESPVSDSLLQDSRSADVYRDITPISVSLKEESLAETVLHYGGGLTQDDEAADLLRPLSALSDILTEIDTVAQPMSDLYIFESGTRDFILSPRDPDLDHQQIYSTAHLSLSLPEDTETDPDRNTRVFVLSHRDSAEAVTQSHHQLNETGDSATVGSESELGQPIGPGPPVAAANEGGLISINDVSQGKVEVSGSTAQARRSDSPNELWLDACQYLAGEDKDNGDDGARTILDEWGYSAMEGGLCATGDASSLPGETQVSGYAAGEADAIGWSSGDTGVWGPPVERWSSVDSWASALSDWAAIITAPPEGITAAFVEIGAEIDALTQALACDRQTWTADQTDAPTETPTERQGQEGSQAEAEAQAHQQSKSKTQPPMAIQDQALEPETSPNSGIHPGKSSLSSSHTEPADLSALAVLRDREGTNIKDCYKNKEPGEIQTIQDERSPSLTHTDTRSSLTSSSAILALPEGYSVDVTDVTLIPGCPSSAVLDDLATDLSLFGGHVGGINTDIYISNKEDSVLLHITEDVEEELENINALAELSMEKPFRDGVCKVTEEHSVSQRGSVAKKGGKASYGSALTFSGFSGSEIATANVESSECAEGSEQSRELLCFNTHTLTNTHVPAVNTPSGLRADAHKHVSSDTSPDNDGAHQGELQFGVPRFIMPIAPLGTGSSLLSQTNNSLEDQDSAKRFLDDNKGHSCTHIQPCGLWPTFEGITDKSSWECQEEKQLTNKKQNIADSAEESSPDKQSIELAAYTDQCLNKGSFDLKLYSGDTTVCFLKTSTITQEISDLSRELSNLVVVPGDHFLLSEKDHIAYVTLDINDPLFPRALKPTATGRQPDQSDDQPELDQTKPSEMPHKTHKSTSECKTHPKKDKSAGYHHAAQTSKGQENMPHHLPVQRAAKMQENHPPTAGTYTKRDSMTGPEGKDTGPVMIETIAVTEKVTTKPHGKKKKKHTQNATVVKNEVEPLVEEENGAKQKTAKARIDIFEAKLGTMAGKTKDKSIRFPSKKDSVQADSAQRKPQQPKANDCQGQAPPCGGVQKDLHPTNSVNRSNDDVIKRRRLSEDKFGKIVGILESKLTKPEGSIKAKREEPKEGVETTRKKAYSEVVKQKTHIPKEDPKVVQPIQAISVSEDPQSLCLWCQFTAVFTDYTVTWSRGGTVLAEIKRSAGDGSRVSVTISKASHKDLGKYQCLLSSPHGAVTLDYLLTYEVLSEIVIPASPKTVPSAPAEGASEEEDVRCSKLMFREDFLSDQYFGENQPASIITEKVHFGEGMHRRAFRTRLQGGLVPRLSPGHSCVLKVHNSISYGTKNNDEMVQKNFHLAVEECQVQNTAREYIKAYSTVAQSAETFGEVPEIIPIYLVHRPSSDIPYATLEEELIGDFVKYSVRDGKEINLMRRDSEAGQKCCAFQHWVYHKTDGNLLVTDMQGVGMKLTDVGIATSKKGYKGFKGNCATSFIEQFKALHQCNKYCEILNLKSLQPKPKKPISAPKPKPQPSAAPKKKTFGPTVKGKS